MAEAVPWGRPPLQRGGWGGGCRRTVVCDRGGSRSRSGAEADAEVEAEVEARERDGGVGGGEEGNTFLCTCIIHGGEGRRREYGKEGRGRENHPRSQA